MLQIKEELEDAEMDIGPTTLQCVNSHCRTDQGSARDISNVDGTLWSGVKQEFIEIELTVLDEQKIAQSTTPPAAAGSVNVDQDECINETDLEIGPTALQYLDSTNQQNTSLVFREDMMDDEGNGSVLRDGVEKERDENKRRDSKPYPYTCNICQKVFAVKKYYKDHITYVHGSQSYKCDQCDRTFKCQRYLTVHKKGLHSTDGVTKCNVCGKYVTWRSLKRHMVNMHSDKRRLCKVCGETVKSEDHLQLHLLDVHGQQPAKFNIFICDYCRRTFTKKYTLQTHISYAHARAYYKCNQCEKSFRSKHYLAIHKANKYVAPIKCKVCGKSLKPASMVQHMRQLHSDKQLQCIVCGEKIKSKYNFEQHMNEHRGRPSATPTSSQPCEYVTASKKRVRTELYNCEKCVQTFISKDTFRQHNKLAHSTEPHKNNKCNKEFNLESYFYEHTNRDGKLQYECAVCKKILKTKCGLIGHVTHYHRPKHTGGAESNVYICDYCQKMFSKRLRLIVHITCTHASGSFKCNQCGKSYKCKRYLERHTANTHTALIECNVCGKLLRLVRLGEHMRNMHSGKKLQCRICGEIVTSKQCLHDHMNDIHGQQSEASPFRCNYCLKVYASKKGLNTHIKNLHGTIFHGCSQCEASFKSKTTLQKHIKRKHKDSNNQSTCSDIGKENRASSHPPVGEVNAAVSASTQQQDVVVKKEEPADEQLELGPVMYQHMDSNYRPYKESFSLYAA